MDRERRPARVGVQLNKRILSFVNDLEDLVDGFEVILENVNASPSAYLSRSSAHVSSLHSVSVFPWEAGLPSERFVKELRQLRVRLNYEFFSIHAAKGQLAGEGTGRLIPLEYSANAVKEVASRVREIQDQIGHKLLLENVAESFKQLGSDRQAEDFLMEVSRRCGCGVLFDTSNFVANRINFASCQEPVDRLAESGMIDAVHVAGFSFVDDVAVDSHDTNIAEETMNQLKRLLEKCPKPPMIFLERDAGIEGLETISSEVDRLRSIASPLAPNSSK